MSCLVTGAEDDVAIGRVVTLRSLGTDDWTDEALTLLFSPGSPLRAAEGPKGLLLWMDNELCLLIRPLSG